MQALPPQTLFQLGLRLVGEGQVARLEQLLTPTLLEHPDDGRLVQLRGIVWHARGRFDAAQRCLERAAALVPLAPTAAWCLADCYLRHDYPQSAHAILVHLAGRSDTPSELLPQLARALGQLGDHHLALEVCRTSARREPDNDQPLFGMAWYMHRLSYPAECVLPLLRRAVDLAPDCLEYRLGYGMLLYRAGRWKDAYGPLSVVPPESVRCPRCLERMVDVFDRAGDHTRRDACCAQLLALANPPRDADRQA
jgi:tetratricopeptide (TPR) repeat protein